MDLTDKPAINAEIDALEMTDEQAKAVGFENVAHYKLVFKKLIDLCEACIKSDGQADIKGMLTMAVNLMKAVYMLQTKGMNDEQKAEAEVHFFKLALGMVMESIGGQLLDVNIPDEPKKPEPTPERSGNETLH